MLLLTWNVGKRLAALDLALTYLEREASGTTVLACFQELPSPLPPSVGRSALVPRGLDASVPFQSARTRERVRDPVPISSGTATPPSVNPLGPANESEMCSRAETMPCRIRFNPLGPANESEMGSDGGNRCGTAVSIRSDPRTSPRC